MHKISLYQQIVIFLPLQSIVGVFSNKSRHPICYSVCLSIDMSDSYCSRLVKRGPDILDKRMNLELLGISLNPRNNDSRVTLQEDPLCVKLLSSKGHVGSSGVKLRHQNQRLEKVRSTSHHKSPIRAIDDEDRSVPLISDTVIKVNLDKLWKRGLSGNG